MTDRSNVRIAPSADVSDDAQIGEGSSIWHLAQVRERASLGANCIIGRGAYIGTGVGATVVGAASTGGKRTVGMGCPGTGVGTA